MPDRVWKYMLAPDVQVKSSGLRIVLGLGTGALAALCRLGLSPWLHSDYAFLTAYPAVAIAAFMGGNIGGLLCTVLSLFVPVQVGWLVPSHPMGWIPLLIFGANGVLLTGLVHHLHTMRDRMDAQYQETLAHRSEFLARVSHELRTPLNVAMGRVQMLASGAVPPDRQPVLVEIALRNLRLTHTLVNDLIEVSKSVSPRIDVVLAPLDFSTLLLSICEDTMPAARAQGVKLDTAVEADLYLLGDGERLRQIFTNLLNNAIKFTPAPGTVSVSATARDGRIVASVVDGGIGIDAADLPHIFDPFKQGGPPGYRDNSGLGLGLAIVKQLTEAHGGTVQAHSSGRGKGAIFTLTFPARQRQATAVLLG